MNEDLVLEQIRSALSAEFEILELWLFGSRAKGRAGPSSDYDVLAVVQTDLPFFQRQVRAAGLIGIPDFSLDLLVYTPEEMDREEQKVFSIAKIARQEGRLAVA